MACSFIANGFFVIYSNGQQSHGTRLKSLGIETDLLTSCFVVTKCWSEEICQLRNRWCCADGVKREVAVSNQTFWKWWQVIGRFHDPS